MLMHPNRNCSLEYPGKWSLDQILSYSSEASLAPTEIQHQEQFNSFYFGDNFEVLHLLKEDLDGKVDLIYIDPPFATGRKFSDRDKEKAYDDTLLDHEFLEFLRRRLYLLKNCLSDQGSIYIHIDKKIGHYVKLIADEVFGYENFINDLTRIKCNPKNFARKAYGNYSDMILYYAKNRDQQIWNEVREELSEEDIQRLFPKNDEERGAYTTHPLHAPGETQEGPTGQKWKGMNPPSGRHWRYDPKALDELEAQGLIEWSSTGNPRKKVFAKDHSGKKLQDVWTFKDKGISYVDYPTQKNHDLLKRIILQSSRPESLVMDVFAGSGGTLQMADLLGRKWMGMDISPQASKVVREGLIQRGIACNYYKMV